MPQSEPVIRTFLAAIQEGCGASMASVFVPTWPGMEEAILAHSGPEAAVPELHDIASAFAFAGRQNGHDGVSAVESGALGGALLPIPLVSSLWHEPVSPPESNSGTPTSGRRATDYQPSATTAGWIALRFPTQEGRGPGLAIGQSALGLGARLASLYLLLYDSLTDPLTGLPGRSVLRTLLRRELALARAERVPLSLIFFNPDAFAQVNEAHGRTLGDQVLREAVSRAQAALRRTDLLCRHGAAIFAVTLSNTSHEAAAIVADKLRTVLSATPYLDGQTAVSFSIGIVSISSDEVAPADPVDFIGRAEAALAIAKRDGGARVCVWRGGNGEAAEPLDRLRHAFTGDQDRDYRNMGLLWDTLGLLATSGSPTELAERVTSHLRRALAASCVALFDPGESGPEFRYGVRRTPGSNEDQEIVQSSLTPEQRDTVATAIDTRVPVWSSPDTDGLRRSVTCAVPLLIDGGLVGVLLLAGASEQMTFDESDLHFVQGLGGPLGLALERARNAERLRVRDEHEKRRLVGELKGLRTALRQVRLVYVSRQMEDLITTAHRVADTDATVLITGESGTGKEMIAQTIHQMSSRRNRPLIVVDCGAIPATLIESELFGHEKGAFTGAMSKSIGRLGQADGGTVLLDEIGELPLDVQSKLLRFVQEKQFTVVGSSVVRRVDVRVLAATNRNLEQEVASGGFRGDLYHRLNVIPLAIPPLRERPDDILELARHFLDVFAPKYQKAVRSLGADVEDALTRYSWPGNIRELQNRLMRAVIMSTGETLTLDALSLPVTRVGTTMAPTGTIDGFDLSGTSDGVEDEKAHTATRPAPRAVDASTAWTELRACLASAVAHVARAPGVIHPPLGRWLGNDIVLTAFAVSGQVARRASTLLGLPETTYMRRLRRAQSEAPVVRRPQEWEPVTRAAEQLLATRLDPGHNVLAVAEAHLLEAIGEHLAGNAAAGASVLGTSLPTFRHRLASLGMAR